MDFDPDTWERLADQMGNDCIVPVQVCRRLKNTEIERDAYREILRKVIETKETQPLTEAIATANYMLTYGVPVGHSKGDV